MTNIGMAFLLAMALAAPVPTDPPARAKTHGYALSGTITSVDEAHKTFVVKNAAGKDTKLVWTSATTVSGGTLKAGEKTTLRYLDKDGKHIATSVSLGEPAPARTPAAPTTPAPGR